MLVLCCLGGVMLFGRGDVSLVLFGRGDVVWRGDVSLVCCLGGVMLVLCVVWEG